jgi:RHS repeat-associated protein
MASSIGPTTSYTYASGSLTEVTHPNGSQSTFTYGQDPVAQTATATSTTVYGSRPAKSETRHLTNDYMTLTEMGQAQVINQPTAILRMIVDNDQSLQYMNLAPNDPTLAQSFQKIAGSKALIEYGSGQYQTYDSWQFSTNTGVSLNVYPGITGNPNPNVWGADNTPTNASLRWEFSGWTTPSGEHVSLKYDANGNTTERTFFDNTVELASFNDFRQPTRKQGRNGSVELMTYDSNGHLLSRKTGLVFQAGTDVQTPSFAETKYEYYPTGHVNAGMLKFEFGPLYNAAQPTLYRTDYEYDSIQRMTKKTESPDVAGGVRPVTQLTYSATTGQLASVTNPEGQVTSYTYDVASHVITTTYPDGSTEQDLYGTGVLSNKIVKSKNRVNVVTTYAFDADGRLRKTISPAAIDANILDGQADDSVISDPDLQTIAELAYLPGSSIVIQQKVNNAITNFYYDYQNRLVETRVFPRAGTALVSSKVYSNNQLLFDLDPYGRRKYYGYRASDGTLIRTITCTVPEQTFADFSAVWNATRVLTPNATYIINDAIRGEDGRLTQVIDGRGIETRFEYDAQGRETSKRTAFGTSVEARTDTLYNPAGQVTEVRSARYFDSTDTNGFQKAREQWTYNGRGKILTHTVSPGTAEGAAESFTYDLHGHQATRTDFGNNVWTRIEDSCCDKQTASVDPLGHGTITNTDSLGRATHVIEVSDVSTHVGSFANPTDAKTLRESTTKYDAAGRVAYQTTWLVPRGLVDPTAPPIAGLNGVPASDGLTNQYFYDNNLTDGAGLDSATGLSVLKLATGGSGSFNVTLANAITKLADTEANGGAGITFNASSPGRATVTVNSEDEISFAISDAAGRNVMSGKLNNYRGSGATAVNTLATWNCTLHDSTTNLPGYGTLLVSKSIDPLGYTAKSWSDAAGRTIRSLDQLDNATAVTYDAQGNQLSVRDPNNVGADMIYDSLGRNTQRTDTFGDVTKTEYDLAGNAVKQIDAKNKNTLITYDSRGRRRLTTDRISAPTTYTYTALGQLASLSDAENQPTSYTYDARGLKQTETYPDHTGGSTVGQTGYGIVTFVYDNAGRVLRKQDQLGDTTTYNYDLVGRMTKRDYRTAANSPSGTIADSDTFTFDRAGRMLTAVNGRYTNTVGYTFDPIGRKASESLTISGQTYTVGIAYNNRNELIKYTYPDGSIADRSYYPIGALNELKLDGSVLSTRSYDAGRRQTTDVLGNGITETRTYRNDNLLSAINYSNTSLGNMAYTWDANKNKTSESITGVMSGYGFTAAGTTYDNEDRLTGFSRAATSGPALLSQSWNLTSVGDWTSVTTNGTAQSRTHGPTHELLTAGGQNVATDVKGNITTLPVNLRPAGSTTAMNLNWDSDNKLRSADIDANGTADVNFQYDALGRRVARSGTGGSVVYVQMDQQTIADYPVGGAATTPTFRYVYASYIDEPVVRKTAGTGGTLVYFHRNHQYSITAVTTSAGTIAERYAYSAYGHPTILDASGTVLQTSNFSLRYSFTGREWDATLGLYHFRARWMNPSAGRFLTRDPIGYEGSPSNFYVYCISSPLFFTDSSGLIVEKRTVCIYRLLSIMIDSDNPPELCAAEFEIERVCQTGKRDDFNHPRHRDGWYYWPVNTFISTYIIEGGIHPDYCGPCAGIYISLNGLPKNGNIPPQNTDTGWVPEPPVLIPL